MFNAIVNILKKRDNTAVEDHFYIFPRLLTFLFSVWRQQTLITCFQAPHLHLHWGVKSAESLKQRFLCWSFTNFIFVYLTVPEPSSKGNVTLWIGLIIVRALASSCSCDSMLNKHSVHIKNKTIPSLYVNF